MARTISKQQLLQEVMARMEMPLAEYSFSGRSSTVICSPPPFPPSRRLGKRRVKLLGTSEFLRHRGGFVPADVAAFLTELEWRVERTGVCLYKEVRVTSNTTSMARIAEVSAFGVAYRVVFHRASFDI